MRAPQPLAPPAEIKHTSLGQNEASAGLPQDEQPQMPREHFKCSPSPVLPLLHPPQEKGSSRQEGERSKANLSFRRGVFLLNKVGFKTQTVAASESLTLSVDVTSKQSAQPGLPWPAIEGAPVGLSPHN